MEEKDKIIGSDYKTDAEMREAIMQKFPVFRKRMDASDIVRECTRQYEEFSRGRQQYDSLDRSGAFPAGCCGAVYADMCEEPTKEPCGNCRRRLSFESRTPRQLETVIRFVAIGTRGETLYKCSNTACVFHPDHEKEAHGNTPDGPETPENRT